MRISTTVEWLGENHCSCGETNEEIARIENRGHAIKDVVATKVADDRVMFTIKYE